jgi:hypothetical protein
MQPLSYWCALLQAATELVSIIIYSEPRVATASESANIVHQIPNVVCRFNFAESRHSGVADSVLDNPKQLLDAITLRSKNPRPEGSV